MKVTVPRLALVALLAALVGVTLALVVYVTVVAAVVFFVIAAIGTALAFRRRKRIPADPTAAPGKIERP